MTWSLRKQGLLRPFGVQLTIVQLQSAGLILNEKQFLPRLAKRLFVSLKVSSLLHIFQWLTIDNSSEMKASDAHLIRKKSLLLHIFPLIYSYDECWKKQG